MLAGVRAAGLGTLLFTAGCTSLPPGWVFVTRVTRTEATVVWTGSRLRTVHCHGPDGRPLGPPTKPLPFPPLLTLS